MTRTQALLVVLTCVLLGAWLVHGLRPARGIAALGRPAARLAAVDPAPDAIARQAKRLREHLSAPPPFLPPHRNPFHFREAPRPAPKGRSASVLGTSLVERPTRPEMRLVGVADDGRNGDPLRTAIVATAGQLFFLKEGDRLLTRYEVVRISADAAQFRDPDGQVFTLALK